MYYSKFFLCLIFLKWRHSEGFYNTFIVVQCNQTNNDIDPNKTDCESWRRRSDQLNYEIKIENFYEKERNTFIILSSMKVK